MQEAVATYLYQPSTVLEALILLVILFSFSRPAYLIAVISALLLLRPNERFDCYVSYPKVIYPVLALSVLLHSSAQARREQFKVDRHLLFFLAVIALETLLLHPADLAINAYYIIVGLALYYVAILSLTDLKGAALLSFATMLSCFLICGEAAYYHYSEEVGSQIWNYFHVAPSGRLQAWGNWKNANETAFLACIGVANVVFLWFRIKTKALFLAGWAVILFFGMVVFLTASRAGLASLVLFFLPMVIILDSKPGKVVAVAAVLAALLFSGSIAPERRDAEASTMDRSDLRYRGEHLFAQYPVFGVGFLRARNEFAGQPLHNTYLQALVETGSVGAPFLFYYLFGIGQRIYKSVRLCKNKGLPGANLAVVSGLFLSSMFYFTWANQLLSLMFFLTIAQVTLGLRLAENDMRVAMMSEDAHEAG
jgi:hypothetical protein